jgi:hypothetical protein
MLEKKQEEKTVNEAVEKKEEGVNSERKEETTIEGAIKQEEKPTDDRVPLAALMEEKRQRLELEAKIKELEEKANPTNNELKEFVEEYGQDALDKVSKPLKDQIKAVEAKMESFENEKRTQQQKVVLDSLYKTAIGKNPEYKSIANKEHIIAIALQGSNRNKTMSEILREVYGKVTPSEESTKTMETKRGNDSTPDSVDFSKFDKLSDDEQMAVLEDPTLKAEYNKFVESRLDL